MEKPNKNEIKPPEKEITPLITPEEHRITDKYDMTIQLIRVHAKRPQQSITTDLVLAHLKDEKDKQYVLDMDFAATYVRKSKQNPKNK